MPLPRTWWMGSGAKRRGSPVVRPAGDLITDQDGRAAVGDGSTADSDLALLVQGRDIPVEAGISAALADRAGRAAWWVRTLDGAVGFAKILLPVKSVDVSHLADSLAPYVLQPVAPESGYVLIAGDVSARSPLAITTAGRTKVWGLDVGSGGITGGSGGTSGGGGGGTAGMVSEDGTSPNRRVLYAPAAGGAVTVVGPTDSHNPSLTVDGSRVLFYVGSGTVQQVSTPGSGIVVPAVSSTDLECFGDSLTEGVGSGGGTPYAQAYPVQLAGLLGVDAQNEGIGGQVSSMIAARQGCMRSTLAAAATVPADNATAVTMTLSGDPMWSGNLPRTRTVTIGGIPGTLVRNASPSGLGAPAGYSFTRTTSGSATPLPVGALVVFDSEITGRSRTQIMWAGRNDVRQGYGTAPVFTAASAFWTDRDGGQANYVRRKLLIGITTQLGETPTDLAAIRAYNAAQAATYGANFLDIDAYLRTTQALTDAGITPTSQDTTDIANGLIPTSLHSSDGLHFLAVTYGLVAARVKARFITLGWSS